MIPYLLLLATIIFATSDLLRRVRRGAARPSSGVSRELYLPLFAVAVYGGYFGAGVWIVHPRAARRCRAGPQSIA